MTSECTTGPDCLILFSVHDESLEPMDLPPIFIFFSDLLNFINKLNPAYSWMWITIHWMSIHCMAQIGNGGTAAACSGTHLPAFVDGSKEARTKNRSSLRAASVWCFPLVAKSLFWPGRKEFSKGLPYLGIAYYSGKKPGLFLKVSTMNSPGPMPKDFTWNSYPANKGGGVLPTRHLDVHRLTCTKWSLWPSNWPTNSNQEFYRCSWADF